MLRRSQKLIQACFYISQKYQKPLHEVLAVETRASNVYLELEADGFLWDAHQMAWVSTNPVPEPTPEPPRPYINVAIRLMTESKPDMIIAEAAICDALHSAGIVFSKEPRSIPNHGGSGMRCYIEVEV